MGEYQDFENNSVTEDFIKGIKAGLEYAETCTLVVLSDLIRFGAEKYYHWCSEVLNYLGVSKRQFLIMDVLHEEEVTRYNLEDVNKFRASVKSDYLKYGAAYFPYLKSLTPYAYDENKVTFKGAKLSDVTDNAKKNQITEFLQQNIINMPPAAFMAGIYSRVDNSDGVWVALANTVPVGATGPLVDLTDIQQKKLNVDADTGK